MTTTHLEYFGVYLMPGRVHSPSCDLGGNFQVEHQKPSGKSKVRWPNSGMLANGSRYKDRVGFPVSHLMFVFCQKVARPRQFNRYQTITLRCGTKF